LHERGGHRLDPPVQLRDVSVQGIDPGEHLAQQERVMLGEVPGERLLLRGDLAAQRRLASCASAFALR
jgi:hypothetical protein